MNIFADKKNTRTAHSFPNVLSVERQSCPGGFFSPSSADIEASLEKLRDYFKSPIVGLLLPLASEREKYSFPKTLNYAIKCGIDPERIIIVYSPQAQSVIDSLEPITRRCVLVNESVIENLFNIEKIYSIFGVNLAQRKGKGRALAIRHLQQLF